MTAEGIPKSIFSLSPQDRDEKIIDHINELSNF